MSSRFIHCDPIDLTCYLPEEKRTRGFYCSAEDVLKHLAPRLTAERWQKIQKVVAARTYEVTPVLENIYDRGNTSAVMRSAEAMGFQSIRLIELGDRFKEAKRVTAGADKWLDIIKSTSTREAVQELKSRGYRILATHLDSHARPLDQESFNEPIAIVFGNEKDGISPEMQALSDQTVILPMRGFVQSYNISVAAAIAFQMIQSGRQERRQEFGTEVAELTLAEQRVLQAHYVLKTLDNPVDILARCL